MAGLNAGSELDHELEDTPPEGLDLSQDSEQFVAMEAALADLSDLASDIMRTGGMSRAFAVEAHRIVPNLLSASSAFFSESPTGTRFKVSLEEIDKGVWALVIAGVTIVLGAIYKIWKWLSGDKEGDGNSASATAGVSSKIEEVESVSDSTVHMADGMLNASADMRAHPIKYTDKDGKEVRWNSMDQLIEAVFVNDERYGEEKKSLLNPHPIHFDIVNAGPYSKMVGQLAKAQVFNRVAEAIKNKIKLLEEIEHKDRNAQGNVVPGLQKQLDEIASPITVTFESKTLTLSQLAARLREEREAAESRQVHRLHFDELFHKISTAYKDKHLSELLHQMLSYLPVLDEMQAGLDRTERFAGDLTQDGQPGGNSPQIAQRVRAVIGVLHGQLTGFAALTNEINHYVHYFKSLSKTAEGFGKEIVRKVSLRMKEAEVTEVPTEWKKVVASINASLEAMEKSHYPSGSKRKGIMGILGRR